MTASPSLPLSNSSLKKSNNELVTALKHSISRPSTPQTIKDDRQEYEITVKLFFLPQSSKKRGDYIEGALDEVKRTLGIENIDLLILSFPEITLDADDTESFEQGELDQIVETYNAASAFVQSGVIKCLGIAEFSATRLRQLCESKELAGRAPSVNQINLKDCCVMPRDLILYAKEKDIKLFTHGDSSNILPPETMHEVLGADAGTPGWVCKYTAVIKSRGVIESKGYLVMIT